jgi:arginine decarboxylase
MLDDLINGNLGRAEVLVSAVNQIIVPKMYMLVSGNGDAKFTLNAFDRALRCAGVGDLNLVKVTSILPPQAVPGLRADIPDGAVVFAAVGSITSSQPGELLSAAVAVGIPTDASAPGVLMEGSSRKSASVLEEEVRYMAEVALIDRGLEAADIRSVSTEHRVVESGAAFAAVLLW